MFLGQSPTHSCGLGIAVDTADHAHPLSLIVGRFIMRPLNLRNRLPCSGFVKKSPVEIKSQAILSRRSSPLRGELLLDYNVIDMTARRLGV